MTKKRKEEARTEPSKEEMLGLDQAAAALGVSRSTLTRWMNQGRLRGFKVGRQWRFRRSDLDKFGEMSHPSAAAVNVAELEEALAGAGARPEEWEATILPALERYPATEEEKVVEKLLRVLIGQGVNAGASDIHIDAGRDDTVVRQRIDGVLHEVIRLPRSAHKALLACIKYHAGLLVDQEQLPQDGRFQVAHEGAEHDLRVATLPSVYGESAVMRLLAQAAELPSLDRLGMAAADIERFRRAIRSPNGIVIVTGPTGSGKTTTLYAALQQVARPELKVLSIEDPVECAIPWVTQTAVNAKAGLTFEHALRSFMRQDPDVIMVGEIRTLQAAELCLQAAITGHLVLTTLHARDAAGAVVRLLEMGVEPFMATESLLGVAAMRLVRRVCPECAQPEEPAFSVLSPLAERARAGGYELPTGAKFVRGAGCKACRGTGYRHRTAIFEVLEVDPEIARLIITRQSAAAIQEAAVKKGMTTLAADGLRKAAEGITTVAEATRVTLW